MNQDLLQENRKAKARAAVYNAVPTIFWSVLSLVPVSVFCYKYLATTPLVLFLVASIIPSFLPASFINKFRLSGNTKLYRKLGVPFIQQLTQHGRLVNTMVRKRYPNYKAVRRSRPSIQRLISQTYMFEKFHWVLFLFFALLGIHAASLGLTIWSLILWLINICYNGYPILLQQFIRLKLL